MRTSPIARQFATAVLGATALLPAVATAHAQHKAGVYSVTYTLKSGSKAEVSAPTQDEALSNFLKAVLPACLPDADRTRYLAPLSPDTHALLGLSKEEKKRCRVMQTAPSCYAVAELVPRDEWHHLQPGDQILYTALQYTAEDKAGALTTSEATLLVYDPTRSLLYANYTPDEENASIECLEGTEAHELWLVWRYINAAS